MPDKDDFSTMSVTTLSYDEIVRRVRNAALLTDTEATAVERHLRNSVPVKSSFLGRKECVVCGADLGCGMARTPDGISFPLQFVHYFKEHGVRPGDDFVRSALEHAREPGLSGIERIAAERRRQIEIEGWTPEHDAGHGDGELVAAAMAYARHGTPDAGGGVGVGDRFFPKTWHPSWWKPQKKCPLQMTGADRVRHLEKAGALLAAEIDRILAAEAKKTAPEGITPCKKETCE